MTVAARAGSLLACRTLLFVLLISSSSCAARGLGGAEPRWRRVSTEHFVVYTDLRDAEARERAALLERYLSAYLQHGWEHYGELPLKLNVVLFERPGDFQEFARERTLGGYYTQALFEPWAVLPASNREEHLDTLRHELSHYLAFMAMPHQPTWFAEGIASYFETARFSSEGDFVVGKVPLSKHALLMNEGLLPARALFENTSNPSASFYATAWLLVHYLMSQRDQEFVTYQRALAMGKGHGPAWNEAFPGLAPEKLDSLLKNYAREGSFLTVALRMVDAPHDAQVDRLSRADEYGLRAVLYGSCGRCGRRGEQRRDESVQLALALDPAQLIAGSLRLLDSREPEEQKLEQARSLVARHESSWLAWLTLATISHDVEPPAATFAAVRRAIELAPQQPYARMLAAWVYLRAGQRDDALRESALALRLQATSLSLLTQRALLLAELAECEPLVQTLTAIEAQGHERLEPDVRARLASARSGCVAGNTSSVR